MAWNHSLGLSAYGRRRGAESQPGPGRCGAPDDELERPRIASISSANVRGTGEYDDFAVRFRHADSGWMLSTCPGARERQPLLGGLWFLSARSASSRATFLRCREHRVRSPRPASTRQRPSSTQPPRTTSSAAPRSRRRYRMLKVGARSRTHRPESFPEGFGEHGWEAAQSITAARVHSFRPPGMDASQPDRETGSPEAARRAPGSRDPTLASVIALPQRGDRTADAEE